MFLHVNNLWKCTKNIVLEIKLYNNKIALFISHWVIDRIAGQIKNSESISIAKVCIKDSQMGHKTLVSF